MLRNVMRKKRMFVSACEMANANLADELFNKSSILSLAGPRIKIGVDDAAAFWVSFYHLMFKIDGGRMVGKDIKEVLDDLSALYEVQMNYMTRSDHSGGPYTTHEFPT